MNGVGAGALCFILLACGTVLLFCSFVSTAHAANAKYMCADTCKMGNSLVFTGSYVNCHMCCNITSMLYHSELQYMH
jgi:hypothetical protein